MSEIQKRKCPYCGGLTPVGGDYCAVCNSRLANAPTQDQAERSREQSTSSQPEHDEFFGEANKTCLACGRQIKSSATYCPVCGNIADKYPTKDAQPTTRKSNQPWETFAIIGFILSFFDPVVGIVFCALALKRDISPSRLSLAKAGLILSIIFTAIIVLVYVFIYAAYGISYFYLSYPGTY